MKHKRQNIFFKNIIVALLLSFIFTVNLSAKTNSAPYPEKSWPTKTLIEAKVDLSKFQKFIDFTFDQTKNYHTHSIVVIKDGYLIFEKSSTSFDSKRPHRMWSISKSITSALIGNLVNRKLLNLDDRLVRFYPQLEGSEKERMTLEHVLSMSSGLQWDEGYENSDLLKSDVVKLLYLEGLQDMPNYVTSKFSTTKPGTVFNYSSGDTMILAGLFNKVLPHQEANLFPWTALFDKIGIKSATFEKDQASNFVGAAYSFMSAQDLARVGHLYLNKGKWKEQQVLPEWWTTYSCQVAKTFHNYKFQTPTRSNLYGAQWWLNKDIPEQNILKKYPHIPSDVCYAIGHHGQYLFILPSQNLIVVRTAADTSGQNVDIDTMIKYLLNSIPANIEHNEEDKV